MNTVRVGTRTYLRSTLDDLDHGAGQTALAWAYRMEVAPVCLCRADGIPMHVARTPRGRFCLKRNPGSGASHHIECLSFSLDDASTSSGPSESTSAPNAHGARPGHSGLSKLLRRLWRETRFNCWHPAMTGKRNLNILRNQILAAARNLHHGDIPLDQCISVQYPDPGQDWQSATHKLETSIRQGITRHGLNLVLIEVDPGWRAGEDRLLASRWCKGLSYRLPSDCDVLAVPAAGRRFALVEVTALETERVAVAAGIAMLSTTSEFLPIASEAHVGALASLIAGGYRFVVPLRNETNDDSPVAMLAENAGNRFLYCAAADGLTAQSAFADRLFTLPLPATCIGISVYLPAVGIWQPSLVLPTVPASPKTTEQVTHES